MIQNVLRHLGGIENYGIVSLMLFFACFLGMLVWALLLKKPFLKEMSHLPLDPESEETYAHNHNHE